ncbi:MAG: ABC transporter ATP-binding protein [Mariprofundaceae bacterium]
MTNPSDSGLTLSGPAASLHAACGSIILLRGDVGSGKSLWLERMAGLKPLPEGMHVATASPADGAAPVLRMQFDRTPSLWLGQNAGEELCFGLSDAPDVDALTNVLHDWRLDKLDLQADVMSLNRLQGIRLSLAAMDLAGATLALLDNPTDALPGPVADQLIGDIEAWVGRSDCIVVVACNRWQDWQSKASQIWQTLSPMQMPELDPGEA